MDITNVTIFSKQNIQFYKQFGQYKLVLSINSGKCDCLSQSCNAKMLFVIVVSIYNLFHRLRKCLVQDTFMNTACYHALES